MLISEAVGGGVSPSDSVSESSEIGLLLFSGSARSVLLCAPARLDSTRGLISRWTRCLLLVGEVS